MSHNLFNILIFLTTTEVRHSRCACQVHVMSLSANGPICAYRISFSIRWSTYVEGKMVSRTRTSSYMNTWCCCYYVSFIDKNLKRCKWTNQILKPKSVCVLLSSFPKLVPINVSKLKRVLELFPITEVEFVWS